VVTVGDKLLALVIGLVGSGIIGYCVAARSVTDQPKVWISFFVVAGMAFALTLGITPATGPEEGILANADRVIRSEFGAWALVGSVFSGVVVGGITVYGNQQEDKQRDEGPSHSG
jgi:hypothetical protein